MSKKTLGGRNIRSQQSKGKARGIKKSIAKKSLNKGVCHTLVYLNYKFVQDGIKKTLKVVNRKSPIKNKLSSRYQTINLKDSAPLSIQKASASIVCYLNELIQYLEE